MFKVTSLFLLFFIGISFAQESGEVIISEILYNANSSEANTQTQLIELVNTTASPINLENWTIDDEDGDGPNTLPAVILPPFGVIVITGSSSADFQGAFGGGIAHISLLDIGETMINMSNSPSATSEILSLRDASNALVDEVNFDDGGDWPTDSPDGTSIILNVAKNAMNATSNNDGNNWAKAQDGVKGGFTSTASGVWNDVEITSAGNIEGDQTLPVSLTSFKAIGAEDKVSLSWETASETDNQGFAILRSLHAANNFIEIDSYEHNVALKGAGTTSQSTSYKYDDIDVVNGTKYDYKLVDISIDGIRTEHFVVSATPQVENNTPGSGNLPKEFTVYANYPNPFNPETNIVFDVPDLGNGSIDVSVTIFNALGQKVITLFNGALAPQAKKVLVWNSEDQFGSVVPSGVYFYQIKSESFVTTQRMTLLK